MVDYLTPAELKGRVIEQRAALRRNLVNRLFRLGNGVQAQSQQLLSQQYFEGLKHPECEL